MINTRWFCALVAVGASLGLASCGGGGGSDASPDTKQTSSAASSSLTLSQTTLAVQGYAGYAPTAPAEVMVTVTNPPAAGLHFQATTNGSAVVTAQFVANSATSGQLNLTFPDPTGLGAGTYNGTVKLSACYDTACAQPVTGSPATLSVTYTVAPYVPPPPSFDYVPFQTGFEAHTAETTTQFATARFSIRNVPESGLFLRIMQSTNGFVTHLDHTLAPTSDGAVDLDLQLTIASPATMGSGFFKSSLTYHLCLDADCNSEVTGSPVDQSLSYNVYLTEGREYARTQVSNSPGISDLAYDTVSQKLYVTGLAAYTSSAFSASVTQIDPTSGAVGARATLSEDLSKVAVSDDGAYLYAASTDQPVVHRLKLPSLQADLDIPLGTSTDPYQPQGPNIVSQMAVAPGEPQTIAVALGHPGSVYTPGTVIFDGVTARPQTLAPLGYYAAPDSIAWSNNSGVLYMYRYSPSIPEVRALDAFFVNASGFSMVANTLNLWGTPDVVGQFVYDQARLYDQMGYVRDAATNELIGQFTMPGNQTPPQVPADDQIFAVVPDSAHARVFFLVRNSNGQFLLYNFDAQTYTLLAVAKMSGGTRMIPWGTQGLAINAPNLEILSGSFYAQPTNSAIYSVRTSAKHQIGVLFMPGSKHVQRPSPPDTSR